MLLLNKIKAKIPSEYNGLPISNKWKNIGGKPKQLIITNYMGYKLAHCSGGYALLCNIDGCYNLMTKNNICTPHTKQQEL
jgi:hypothetical protein